MMHRIATLALHWRQRHPAQAPPPLPATLEAETALLLLPPIASPFPAAKCTQMAAADLQLVVLLLAIQMLH